VGQSLSIIAPVALMLFCATALVLGIVLIGRCLRPNRAGHAGQTPYESGMDPIHDTRRRFDVRFHLLAIVFLIFDVELLFLYPWAVAFGDAAAIKKEIVTASEITSGDQTVTSPQQPDSQISPSPRLPVSQSSSHSLRNSPLFPAAMVFLALLAIGFVYDWRKGVFQWH
jgi:NADH-quinone oxidoreductase subunit A